MRELYIGLMSGTSVDGIDAALVDFSEVAPQVIATHYTPYKDSMREAVLSLCQADHNEIERLGKMDHLLGQAFADSALTLLDKAGVAAHLVTGIGSHGQTIRHRPNLPQPFTLQIGDPNIIAAKTGITTVADFRRKDMAQGGQGAPLVPAFHHSVYHSKQTHRAIVNIGGMANATLLFKDDINRVLGFDTGPGNVLLDAWIKFHQGTPYDQDGSFAASGKVQTDLLTHLLSHPFFSEPAPKSTGREMFHLTWLQSELAKLNAHLLPCDVQATLVALTYHSIMRAITEYLKDGEIILCGGGVRNQTLLTQFKTGSTYPHFKISTTQEYDIDADWIEAVAFAWLAKQTLDRKPGNLMSVTGASRPVILGGIYLPD